MPPTLEAVMPAYNSVGTIAAAITSAWTDNQVPVVVVDDGSTDDTADVASGLPGVRLLRQPNAGPSAARNRGILTSTADFVLFLDSDDLLLPGYREQFERAVRNAPHSDVFVCGMQVRDLADTLVSVHQAPSLSPTPFLSVLRGESVPTNGIIIRRSVLARSGLFNPALQHAEDLDLWLRVAAVTDRWVAMPDPLAVYHLSSVGLSSNGPQMWRGVRTVLSDAARRPAGSWVARRLAVERGRRTAAAYVYGAGYARRVQAGSRESARALTRELVTLPPRVWPHAVRHVSLVAAGRLRALC